MRITLNKQLSQEILKNLGIERRAGNVKTALRLEAILLLSGDSENFDMEEVARFCINYET